MTDLSWFRLAMRIVGLLLIGLGIPAAIGGVSWFFNLLSSQRQAAVFGSSRNFPLEEWLSAGGYILGPLLQVAFGCYLLFGGHAIIKRCVRDLHDRCHACGYPIKGLREGRCPECGAAVVASSAEPPVSTGA